MGSTRRQLLTTSASVAAAAAIGGRARQAGAQEKTKVNWWHISVTEPGLSAWQRLADEYMAANPNVEIEILTFELREFEAKLAVSLPAGSGPDILTLHDFIFPRYYEGGNLADMPDDLVKAVNDKALAT